MKIVYPLICFLFLSLFAKAQTIYSTDFGPATTGTPPNPFNPTPLVINSNVTTTGWTGGTVFFAGVTGGAYCNNVANGNGTYSITLNVASGYSVNINAVNFQMRRTATGPTNVAVSVAGNTFTVTGAPPNGSFGAISASGTATGLTGAVTISITTSGGTGASQNNRLDDLAISGTSVLPVKLHSFTALRTKSAVELKWNVSSESGISTYEIQRSIDGINFEKLSDVTARNLPNYSFIDNSPITGAIFYRLKINENNNEFSYSETKRVQANNEQFFIKALYPNPTSDMLRVNINNSINEIAIIRIIDISGRKVLITNTSLKDGLTEKIINVSSLNSGVYFIEIVRNGETVSEKFIKN